MTVDSRFLDVKWEQRSGDGGGRAERSSKPGVEKLQRTSESVLTPGTIVS